MTDTTIRTTVRSIVTTAVAVLVSTLLAAPAAAAPAEEFEGFTIAALAWDRSEVDARTGDATAALEWTVANDDPEVAAVAGTISVRPAYATAREYLGDAYEISFGTGCCHEASLVGGTPQRGTYRATVPIGGYGATPRTVWSVTRLTVTADQGEEWAETEVFVGEDLADHPVDLVAMTLVDTAAPTAGEITFADGPHLNPYLYVDGSAAGKRYSFDVDDAGTGFWWGRFELTGPTGQVVTTGFALEPSSSGDGRCAGMPSMPDSWASCLVLAVLPADAAVGDWRVTTVTLVDQVGNRADIRDERAPVLTVTANRKLRATGFVAEPAEVDNWRVDRETVIMMTVEGAEGPLVSVEAVTNWVGGGCYAPTATPVLAPDGRVGVSIMMEQSVKACQVTGVVLRDTAGNVAAYGQFVSGPAVSVALTRRPDPTPPWIGTAALNRTSVPLAEVATAGVTLTVSTDVEGSPLELTFVSLYSAAGTMVCGATAVRDPDPQGTLVMRVYIRPDIVPGDYTVALSLRDTLDRTSDYGSPGGLAMPGGPLVLTVRP